MRETGLQLKLFDPRLALDDFLGQARALCAKRSVEYSQDHSGGGQVRAEPHWINVVLHNLLFYALSNSKNGSVISLQSGIDDLSWRVELEQQGLSADAVRYRQPVEQLFKLPKLNQETRTHTALALSKSIITLHRGRIWAEPIRSCDGLRIVFVIPASSE